MKLKINHFTEGNFLLKINRQAYEELKILRVALHQLIITGASWPP